MFDGSSLPLEENLRQAAVLLAECHSARIVLELHEKMAKESLSTPRSSGSKGGALDDLRSALANLGYKAPQIDRAVQKVKPQADEGAPLSDLVREALRHVQ